MPDRELRPGIYSWVWYVPPTAIGGLVLSARERNIAGYFIKAGDGGDQWSQYSLNTQKELLAAGIDCLPWVYSYGGDPTGQNRWSLDDEIRVAREVLAISGGRLVIDAEAEWERPDAADLAFRYLRSIGAVGAQFLAYSPHPLVQYHETYPYAAFDFYCDAVLPQFYAKAAPWDGGYAQAKKDWLDGERRLDLTTRVIPVMDGHVFTTRRDAHEFRSVFPETPTLAVWEHSQGSSEGWAGITEVAFEMAKIAPTPDDKKLILDQMDIIWGNCNRLVDLGHAQQGEEIRAAILAIKQALRLAPS